MALLLVSSFAERLKEALGDMTLTDFAKKIGLSKQAISNYTTGVSTPKRPTIQSIAIALNVNEAWLMGYDVDRQRPKYRHSGNQLIIEDNGLISLFGRMLCLNETGLEKVGAYVEDLILSGKYQKNNQ